MENLPDDPVKSGVQTTYQEMLNAGSFMIQRCDHCRSHIFFPREFCPHCGETELTWIEPTGEGVVHSVTTVRRKAEMGGDYNVSLIELAEGVRLMSQVEGLPLDQIVIGLPVQARVAVTQEQGLVVFDAIAAQKVLP
jgi:uncharacterized OB-fold protein